MKTQLLGEVAEVIMGQAPSGDTYNVEGRGLPLIAGASDFGPLMPSPSRFTSAPTKQSMAGDILICIRATIGDLNWSDKVYCLGRGVAALRPKNGNLDSRYLWRVVELSSARLAAKGRGATFKLVSRADIDELEIPVPPLDEQRRIAAILDAADSLRVKRRAALAKLDQLAQSIFIEMFGDPIRNERGWPISALEDIARVERGKFSPRPRNDPSYYNGEFPFIQTGDINNSGGRLREWTQTLNERGTQVSRSFPHSTIVIAIVGATIGATAILEHEVYCPDSVIGIQPDAAIATPEFVERILRRWKPIFRAQAPETARANINLETLRPLQVPVPPLSLQQKYTTAVERIEALVKRHQTAFSLSVRLFSSLQHRAFRGEL